MPYFRRRPSDPTVLYEARQFTGDNADYLISWAKSFGKDIRLGDTPSTLVIEKYDAPDQVVGMRDYVVRQDGNIFWRSGETAFLQGYEGI